MDAPFIDDAIRRDREIRDLALVCRCTADITWYHIPNTEWQETEAHRRLDEASTWFSRYCIDLNFTAFALDSTDPDDVRLQQRLDAAVAAYNAAAGRIPRAAAPPREADLDEVQAALLRIDSLLRRKVGQSRLVVVFLDEWYVLVGETANPNHWRQNRVSGNDGERLLIGLDRYDRDSLHILTHELTHALRKIVSGRNRTCVRAFVRRHNATPDNSRTWADHYGGKNQDRAMTRPSRTGAFRPFRKRDSDILTITEYLMIQRGGYVLCTEGCNGGEKRIRNGEEKPKRKAMRSPSPKRGTEKWFGKTPARHLRAKR